MHLEDKVMPVSLMDEEEQKALINLTGEDEMTPALCTWGDCTQIAEKVCCVCKRDGFCPRCFRQNQPRIMQFYRMLTNCDTCRLPHHHQCGTTVITDGHGRSRCDICRQAGRFRRTPVTAGPWRNKVGEEAVSNKELRDQTQEASKKLKSKI